MCLVHPPCLLNGYFLKSSREVACSIAAGLWCRIVQWWWRRQWQCRGGVFNHWSGKTLRAAGRLSPSTTTTEATHGNYWSPRTLEPVFHNKRSHCNEKPVHHNRRSLHSLQLEKACASTRPTVAKMKLIKKLKTTHNIKFTLKPLLSIVVQPHRLLSLKLLYHTKQKLCTQ